MPVYKRPDIIISFLSPNNVPLTSERLSSLKNKLPSIEATILFYLDTHGASKMSEMPECMPHCFGHLPVTVALLCWWQSQLTPRLYHLKQLFCSSVCDKANSFINFSYIQGAYDKSST